MQIVDYSWVFMLAEVVTVIFSFLLLFKISRETWEGDEQNGFTKVIKEKQFARLEGEVNSLQEALEKTRASFAAAENEIQGLNKKRIDLSEELRKEKELRDKDSIQLGRLNKENVELKDKLLSKEQELKQFSSERQTIEKELKDKNDKLQALERGRQEIAIKLKNLEAEKLKFEKEVEARNNLITKYEKKEKEIKVSYSKEEAKTQDDRLGLTRKQKSQKIGEILLSHNLITKEILDTALEYQKQFGRNITQYLLAYGYIDEGELAQCLCTQFAIPYLPLSSYHIPDGIIKLVPVDLAEKYWLIPVDKVENFLTIVMADPLDSKAIKEVEEISGCKVRAFVGLLSEIMDALQEYYKIIIAEKVGKENRKAPFFVDTKTYRGLERRQSVRYDAEISVYFPVGGQYKKCKTKNVSRGGLLLFDTENVLQVGTIIPLQLELPKEVSPLPIAAIVQVVRVFPLENNKFEMGVRLIKISKQELNIILEYASTWGKGRIFPQPLKPE